MPSSIRMYTSACKKPLTNKMLYKLNVLHGITISPENLIDEMVADTNVSKPHCEAIFTALMSSIWKYVSNGRPISIGSIGKFVPSIKTEAPTNLNKTGAKQVKSFSIKFVPTAKFQSALNNVSIQVDSIVK